MTPLPPSRWENCRCSDMQEWKESQPCHWVYVIKLADKFDWSKRKWKKFKEHNLEGVAEENIQGHYYVGQTACHPTCRFQQHKAGHKSAKCHIYMVELTRYDEVVQDDAKPGTLRDQSVAREIEKANQLRGEGYWVWCR